MGLKRQQEYECTVVSEVVKIRLRTKSKPGWSNERELVVQCDQSDCQYVDVNEPPCPLSLSLFEEEIREREDMARARRETSDDY